MPRPTLSACLIVKNEAKNIERVIESVRPFVDEIVITDTGSTDDTVEIAKRLGAKVNFFAWCDDFSKARNANLDAVTTDYFIWLDADDEFKADPVEWENFRSHQIHFCDMWLARYDYAFDDQGRCVCSFLRERIAKRRDDIRWKYFVHEGLMPTQPTQIMNTGVCHVVHKRTVTDLAADKGRNLRLLELNRENADARMLFYFGKELFESGKPKESLAILEDLIDQPGLEPHDKTLAIQTAAYAAMQCEQFKKAQDFAFSGLKLFPSRAEFHFIIADCFVKLGRMADAYLFYESARKCRPEAVAAVGFSGFLYQDFRVYGELPAAMSVKCLFHLGKIDDAIECGVEGMRKHPSLELTKIMAELYQIKARLDGFKTAKECGDVVFTCPGVAYVFDDETFKQNGAGGSETALIQMAKWIRRETNRAVKVFMPRDASYVSPDGVEYLPLTQMDAYFSAHKPQLHVAWRHSEKFTDAYTVGWSHDLVIPGVERGHLNEVLCLSEFHRNFFSAATGYSQNKIRVIRNGVVKEMIAKVQSEPRPPVDKNKVIFVSSPDRGLTKAISVMDLVRLEKPDAELHVYYGFDGMLKAGRLSEVNVIKTACEQRPWVKLHGHLKLEDLLREYRTASVWLYPTDFLETFCISALETELMGVRGVVHGTGALPETVKLLEQSQTIVIPHACNTVGEHQIYAKAVIDQMAHQNEYKDAGLVSWESEARRWVSYFGLTAKN